jgi:hypothetical protein
MPGGRPKIKLCRECGTPTDPQDLSRRKKCATCGARLLEENARGIASHSGPAFDRWRRSMAASVGAVLLDDVLERP